MCFSIDQCIASGIHIFTFANSSRNILLNISFFIHFLYTFCVRFQAKATAGFDIRGLKCPEFLAMSNYSRIRCEAFHIACLICQRKIWLPNLIWALANASQSTRDHQCSRTVPTKEIIDDGSLSRLYLYFITLRVQTSYLNPKDIGYSGHQ